jgi:mevalonate kinase
MGVAVSAALDQHLGVARTPEERATQTLAWERVFHGNPSGVDNTMAAVGGVAFFTRGQPLEPVRVRRPLVLVIGHSGEASETKQMVGASGAAARARAPSASASCSTPSRRWCATVAWPWKRATCARSVSSWT